MSGAMSKFSMTIALLVRTTAPAHAQCDRAQECWNSKFQIGSAHSLGRTLIHINTNTTSTAHCQVCVNVNRYLQAGSRVLADEFLFRLSLTSNREHAGATR